MALPDLKPIDLYRFKRRGHGLVSFLKTGRAPCIMKRKKTLVRPPRRGDLDDLLRFINALVDEDAPILVNKKTTL